MYCIEDSTCDVIGTFQCPLSPPRHAPAPMEKTSDAHVSVPNTLMCGWRSFAPPLFWHLSHLVVSTIDCAWRRALWTRCASTFDRVHLPQYVRWSTPVSECRLRRRRRLLHWVKLSSFRTFRVISLQRAWAYEIGMQSQPPKLYMDQKSQTRDPRCFLRIVK